MIHIWRPWKLSNFQDPPPCPCTPQILLLPRSWTSSFKQSHLQMITNQLTENMIQRWLFNCYMLSTIVTNIKGWLHCLTSESKGRFLLKNILFGSAWYLVMAQKKTVRSEHLLHLPPPPHNISFLLNDGFDHSNGWKLHSV